MDTYTLWAFRQTYLTANDRWMLAVLLNNIDYRRAGYFVKYKPALKQARLFCKRHHTVRRILTKLEKLGLITITYEQLGEKKYVRAIEVHYQNVRSENEPTDNKE